MNESVIYWAFFIFCFIWGVVNIFLPIREYIIQKKKLRNNNNLNKGVCGDSQR